MLQAQFGRDDCQKLRQARNLEFPWSGALITFKVVLKPGINLKQFLAQWNEQIPHARIEHVKSTRRGIYGRDEGVWGQAMHYVFEEVFKTKVAMRGEYEPDSLSGHVYVPYWKFERLTVPEEFKLSILKIEPETSLGIYW